MPDYENFLYYVMLGLGAAAAITVFVFNYKKYKEGKRLLDLAVLALCLLFALVFSFITDYLVHPALRIYPAGTFFFSLGFQYYYTLIYFVLLSVLMFSVLNLDLKLLNIAAPSLALFSCIARVGCIIAGCCAGIEALGFEAFPTAALECAFGAVSFILLQFFIKKYPLRIYLLCYSVFRFLIEFLRIKIQVVLIFDIFSFAQVIAACVLILFLIERVYIFVKNFKHQKNT